GDARLCAGIGHSFYWQRRTEAGRSLAKRTVSFLDMSNRKIIVSIAVSADGFIARKDGAVDWLDRPRPKGNYGMGDFWKSIDTILLGRKTYDLALKFLK